LYSPTSLAKMSLSRQMQKLRRASLELIELLELLSFPFAIRDALLAILS
jgi:hypothetical protein